MRLKNDTTKKKWKSHKLGTSHKVILNAKDFSFSSDYYIQESLYNDDM